MGDESFTYHLNERSTDYMKHLRIDDLPPPLILAFNICYE
jgi:hypothetical protein